MAAHVEQAQDRLGAVPVLAEGGLGPLDGLAGQFPVGVQPVRIADHDDDAVLAVAGRQVLGHLGGQVRGRDADVELAALDLLFAGGRRCRGRRRWGRGRGRATAFFFTRASARTAPSEGVDQFRLAHPVPARDALLAGHARPILFSCSACNLSLVMRNDSRTPPRHGTGTLNRGPGEHPCGQSRTPGTSVSREESVSSRQRAEHGDRGGQRSTRSNQAGGEQKKAILSATDRLAHCSVTGWRTATQVVPQSRPLIGANREGRNSLRPNPFTGVDANAILSHCQP